MEMVTLTINDKQVQVPEGSTILDAAKAANIEIPTLCFLKGINEIGACRMCVVELSARSLQAACVYQLPKEWRYIPIRPGYATPKSPGLILSTMTGMLTCIRSRNCELQALAEHSIDELQFEGERQNLPLDNFSPSIVRDPNKCILCRRCVGM